MTNELIYPHHLQRRAVIYIRQSSVHQVLSNLESQKLQLAMHDRAIQLGWDASLVEIVQTDTGTSAQSTAGRLGYKNLLSELALGEIGIIISYESTRLSRNCSDWYPLLDLCALHHCLIADRDGVYDPSSPNGRLLLGMKGILSEVELHTLRGRLLAGVRNKAQRGELALALPVGLLRLEDGSVVKDPDKQVQDTLDLVFRTFLEQGSCAKVVRHFSTHHLLIPRRHRNEQTIFRSVTLAAVVSILRNPAYAGAFVYGKTRTVRSCDPQRTRLQQKRRPQVEWPTLVKDRYPAYIPWDTFEQIQRMLSDNYAEYDRNKSRGVPRDGDALLQGICYCAECSHKMVVQYKGGSRYICNYLHQQTRAPICQYLPADPIDRHVLDAFFQALSPIELDLYEQVQARCQQEGAQVLAAQKQILQRLQYQADLARRQYDRVDPDNRLVASELERRWDAALRELHQAEKVYAHQNQQTSAAAQIPADLRSAFLAVGKSLPSLWSTLSRVHRKALLRCLIDKVVLKRLMPRERVLVRIVWRGGAFTETELAVPVHGIRDLSSYDTLVTRLLELEAQGCYDDEIAQILTEQGFRSPQRDHLLPSTVRSIRLQHQCFHRYKGARPRRVAGFFTVPQLAQALDIKPHRLYYLIDRGIIEVDRDVATGLYLFPEDQQLLDRLRQLRSGLISRVSCRQEHQDA